MKAENKIRINMKDILTNDVDQQSVNDLDAIAMNGVSPFEADDYEMYGDGEMWYQLIQVMGHLKLLDAHNHLTQLAIDNGLPNHNDKLCQKICAVSDLLAVVTSRRLSVMDMALMRISTPEDTFQDLIQGVGQYNHLQAQEFEQDLIRNYYDLATSIQHQDKQKAE